jgi:lipoprotein-anchoring transpeptidase ErfK/SrfK
MPVPVEPEVPALSPEEQEAIFRRVLGGQTLLDRQNFSCGCGDGVIGEKTRIALRAWQNQKGVPASGEFDEETLAALGDPESVFTRYAITERDQSMIGEVPSSWLEKSQQANLNYVDLQELVAEKFHITRNTLQRLNPDVDWPNPAVGTEVVVPDPAGKRVQQAARIRISLSRKTVRVYDVKGRLTALFPCSIAKDKAKRPVGALHVANCAENPTYFFDPAVFPEDEEAQQLGKRLIIPPGPNNPVGLAWIGLDRTGYGIHGTPHPEDIGKTESHGCFRLANWNAKKLAKMVYIGMPVLIEE